ncbi:MAG: polyprenol monophosphomannose synthase [Actinomycetota bacterium]
MRNRLIIVPTYNELANAPLLIRRIFKHIPNSDVLVVDDGSPDKTGDAIRELQQEFHALHLLEQKTKLGLGSAYRLGFAWGLDRGYEELIEMDADLSHRVRDLKTIIYEKELQPKTDLVIGSRWIPGGSTENWSKGRELLSRTANLYVQAMLGLGVKDSTAGFRIYSSSILKKLNLEAIKSEGYSFQIEMTRAVHKLGGKIIEVPITFRERENGVSKMSKNIVREAMLLVTIWGLKRFLRVK